MGRPLERMPKPNETSFIAFAHLKIKIVCACCSATNTFYLWNACKIEKGGLLVAFAPHTMFAHYKRNMSTSQCRHLETSIARGRNMYVRNRQW